MSGSACSHADCQQIGMTNLISFAFLVGILIVFVFIWLLSPKGSMQNEIDRTNEVISAGEQKPFIKLLNKLYLFFLGYLRVRNTNMANLNIPLDKKRFNYWLFLLCIVIGMFVVNPNSWVSLIITLLFGTTASWILIIGPAFLNNWALNHRYFFARWLVLIIRIIVFYLVIRVLAPLLFDGAINV